MVYHHMVLQKQPYNTNKDYFPELESDTIRRILTLISTDRLIVLVLKEQVSPNETVIRGSSV